jgi:hypothetical protein
MRPGPPREIAAAFFLGEATAEAMPLPYSPERLVLGAICCAGLLRLAVVWIGMVDLPKGRPPMKH